MKILIINGPNINMLGIREPDVYGAQTYKELLTFLEESAREAGVEMEHFQSNWEGAIVDKIQAAYGNTDGIVINPAAFTHTSVAILDALAAVSIPAVEVHLSDVAHREVFRQITYPGIACEKHFSGLGFEGYRKGIFYLRDKLAGEGMK